MLRLANQCHHYTIDAHPDIITPETLRLDLSTENYSNALI